MNDYNSWGERELIEELERRDAKAMTHKQTKALLKIFDYLNEDERKDYYEKIVDTDTRNHIYHDVCVLGDMLGMDMSLN